MKKKLVYLLNIVIAKKIAIKEVILTSEKVIKKRKAGAMKQRKIIIICDSQYIRAKCLTRLVHSSNITYI